MGNEESKPIEEDLGVVDVDLDGNEQGGDPALLTDPLCGQGGGGPPPPPGKSAVLKGTDVYLNVYNIVEEGFFSFIGLGMHHGGVVIHGREWSFGRSDEEGTGVFWVPPRTALPDFKEKVPLGRTQLSEPEVMAVITKLEREWTGRSYHLLTRNCNCFCEEFCLQLGLEAPDWINRAARVVDALVPDALFEYAMENVLDIETPEGDDEPPAAHTPIPAAKPTTGTTALNGEIPLDLEGLTIREIRTVMFLHNISWVGCVEKSDLIDRVEAHRRCKSVTQGSSGADTKEQ